MHNVQTRSFVQADRIGVYSWCCIHFLSETHSTPPPFFFFPCLYVTEESSEFAYLLFVPSWNRNRERKAAINTVEIAKEGL